MTIIDFYQELSDLLEQARSNNISKDDALNRLDQMTQELKKEGIQVEISRDIFDFNNLIKFDDERSYTEEDSSYDDDDYNQTDEGSSYDDLDQN